MTLSQPPDTGALGPWDEEHAKALLHFPRYPVRLIQEEPLQTWISERGGLKGVYEYLRNYSFSPSHRRILEVVIANPEEVSDVYANQLNISRATYFYRLKELVPAVVHALNHWQMGNGSEPQQDAAASEAVVPKLPTPLTGLVGVDTMLEVLYELLLREEIRLLTLLGPGGIGKTRLSIELANQARTVFGDQVGFVDLSALHTPGEILSAIAHSLGLGQSGETSLKSFLMHRKFLLVLDNFEHLLAGASVVSDLLVASPELKVVVTSRAALRLYGEFEFSVPPLPTPKIEEQQRIEDMAANPAVALFIQRARAVNPMFSLTHANVEAVAELCLRMDGIPLAIELAAYQAKYYSPQAMLVRLSNSKRLNFLNQGPKRMHAHQQTPRDILDWSYGLLSADLKVLFNRLAVFTGGCTTDAAEAVCGDDSLPVVMGLAALAEQSLLQQHIQSDGEPRYLMLGVTREYGLEQLDLRGETPTYEKAHANYYLSLAEALYGSRRVWLDSMARERANLRAAMQWFLAQDDGEGALRLAAALWDTWRYSGTQQEGYHLTHTVLEQTASVMLPIRVHVLRRTGWMAHDLCDSSTMHWVFTSMLELGSVLDDPRSTGLAGLGIAEIARGQSRWEEADTIIEQAYQAMQDANDLRQMGWALLGMGRIAMSKGDLDTASARYQEAIAQFEADSAPIPKADALAHQGQALFYAGMLDQAALLLEEALHLKQASEDFFSADAALAQVLLGHIDALQGLYSPASAKLQAGMLLSRQQGYLECMEMAHQGLGVLAARRGEIVQARRSLRESLLVQESLRDGWRCLDLLEMIARFLLTLREPLSAARLLGASERLRGAMKITRFPLYVAEHEQTLTQLRTELDPITLDDAWLAGQGLSLEQAIIYALRVLE